MSCSAALSPAAFIAACRAVIGNTLASPVDAGSGTLGSANPANASATVGRLLVGVVAVRRGIAAVVVPDAALDADAAAAPVAGRRALVFIRLGSSIACFSISSR